MNANNSQSNLTFSKLEPCPECLKRQRMVHKFLEETQSRLVDSYSKLVPGAKVNATDVDELRAISHALLHIYIDMQGCRKHAHLFD